MTSGARRTTRRAPHDGAPGTQLRRAISIQGTVENTSNPEQSMLEIVTVWRLDCVNVSPIKQTRISEMTFGTTAPWPPSQSDATALKLSARSQLGVPAAIVDGLCFSAILWLLLLTLLR
ncbi:hypothetical protein NOVOSPHI9U_20030 [Novosphingobium sp. 9U]|nr:hypothetical protein NOVOSPHI9U_20030 [Novosphingobium sp. 9U]